MNELPGLWFDGRSSAGRDVRIGRVGDALRIVPEEGGDLLWPLSEIAIDPRLGSAPRILRRPGHGQIECADAPELERWFARRSGRIERYADWLERRRWAIAGAALLVLAGTVGFVRWGVPWIATRAAERMPVAVERHVSNQVVSMFERLYFRPSRIDAARQQRLQRGFAALVRGEPRSAQMRLRVVASPVLGPNAFALPDGRIFVTDELVALAASDEELLSVLAHEAGHHVHRHGMRQAIESSSVFLAAGLLFGDVSGSSLSVSIPAVLLNNGFSRGHEREADRYALDLLRRRGHSPAAFADMMARLAEAHAEHEDEGPMGYLSTHPPSAERIRAAREAAR